MIGLCGSQVVLFVTIDAPDPERFKPPHGSRFMASRAITKLMGAGQGKPAVLMNLADVFNNPRLGRMASGTIRTQRGFMQVSMTFNTFPFCS
jgi:hypothetical protein